MRREKCQWGSEGTAKKTGGVQTPKAPGVPPAEPPAHDTEPWGPCVLCATSAATRQRLFVKETPGHIACPEHPASSFLGAGRQGPLHPTGLPGTKPGARRPTQVSTTPRALQVRGTLDVVTTSGIRLHFMFPYWERPVFPAARRALLRNTSLRPADVSLNSRPYRW